MPGSKSNHGPVDNIASLFGCTPAGRAPDSMTAPVYRLLSKSVGDWLWSGPPESYCWFSSASAFQLFFTVESSSLFHLRIRLIFMFSDMLQSFTRSDQMSCVYHGRAKGEGCGHM